MTDEQGQKLKELGIKNNYRSIVGIVTSWAQIAIAIYFGCATSSIVIKIVVIWFVGLKQYALGEVLAHEASHYNVFATRKLNKNLQWMFSSPFFVDVMEYRSFHLSHHKDLGGKTDDLWDTYNNIGLNSRPPTNFFVVWFIQPICGYISYLFVRDEILSIDFGRWKWWIAAYLMIFIACVVAHHPWVFILYWVVPYIWCFPSYFHWQEIEDHYNTRGIARDRAGLIRNTFAFNTGFHYCHHIAPYIPWYNLPKAHQILKYECQDVTKGFFQGFMRMRRRLSPGESTNICLVDVGEQEAKF